MILAVDSIIKKQKNITVELVCTHGVGPDFFTESKNPHKVKSSEAVLVHSMKQCGKVER
jgi:hypothetical protein